MLAARLSLGVNLMTNKIIKYNAYMKLRYKYILYKIYSWSLNKKSDTPIGNTIITLGIVHFFQFTTLLFLIDKYLFRILYLIFKLNVTYVFIIALIYFVLFYLVIYNKNRWNSYCREFENEIPSEKRKGNIYVLLYVIGSILIFFISLPLIFG